MLHLIHVPSAQKGITHYPADVLKFNIKNIHPWSLACDIILRTLLLCLCAW